MRHRLVLTAALGLGLATLGPAAARPEQELPTDCAYAGPGMAPCNPWLAPSGQSATHATSYRQSTYLAPTSATGDLRAEHLDLDGVVTIWADPSPPYPDGSHVLWLNVAGTDQVVKVDPDTFDVIAETVPATMRPGMGVAYYELNAANQVVRLNMSVVEAWGDADPADPASDIVRVGAFPVPPSALCQDEDLVGLAHTYDGHLVVGTTLGNLLVLPADPAQWDDGILATASVNGTGCEAADDTGLELMSNNIAVDEVGGVYAVTDRAMYRYDWDGSTLTQAWRSQYGSESAGAFTAGSGSTPTLSGDPTQDDRFVVITDASRIMRLNLYWRDDVPDGWVPPVGDDPRLACSVPVDFGEPDRPGTKSDQSVVVDGYSSYVVDNTIRDLPELEEVGERSRVVFTQLAGGMPEHAPRGAARIDWDPATRTCRTVWANPEVSFPNGIPAFARDSHQMLGNSLAVRDGRAVFGTRALDADTGRTAWFVPGAEQDCDGAMDPLIRLLGVTAPDAPFTPDLANACENANFAGMTMDDEGRIYTGTSYGLSRWVPVEAGR